MKHSRMQYLLPAVICAIIVFVFSASAAAGVIYVKWNATGTPDGKSWDTAFLKVQEGLDAAASGDEVWVAAGTYVEKLTMKEGTALYGGFVGTESSLDQRDWTANQTILDGNGNSDAVIGSRAIAPGIRVDGFVIRNATYGLWCWSVDARNCTISSRMWGIFACYSPISNPSVSVSVTNCSIASARCLESRGVGSLVVDGCIMSPRDMGVYCSAKSFRLVNNSISGTSGGYLTFGISAGGEGVISGNTIQGMRTGVEFSYRSGSVTIQGNTIRGNTDSGIWCQNASVQIIGNLIENNTTNRSGGGIRCDSTSSLLIKDNVIRGNQAGTQDRDSGGGGIYCKSCSPTIVGNTILRNSTDTAMTSRGNGGGVRLYSCAAAAVRGNRIEGNTALTGGGIAIASCTSTQVTGNRIIGNRAFSGWSARPMCGGIYSTGQELIAGNLVAANTMGGIVCTGAAAIRNNTVVGNNTDSQFASLECTSGAAQVVNNIVAFNTWGVWSTASMFRNNCVFGNTEADVVYSGGADIMAANGNISADPMLADTAYGNLHIQPGSPCIDAGDDSAVGADETDIDGQSRIQGSHVDIGADESDGTEWPSGQYSVVRVTPTGSDSNDGSGWDNARAMKTVQSALDAAALKGGEVWVKAGVYPELVSIPAYAYLYGGFAGTETDKAQRDWHKNETVLDGQQKGTVVIIPGGYNVTCVDGFTVRNGKSLAHYHDAGGIECSGCSTIAHNTVADNVGTGIVTSYSYSATVSDNTIRGNTEGAVACGSIHPVLTGNAIVGNTFTSDYSNSACVLVGPSPGSGFYGGPDNASAVPYGIVTNNVIAGNTAYNSVVWLNNVEAFANNTIVANTVATTGYPRALYAWGDNFGRAENNVIAFNTGSVGQLRYSGTGSAFAVYRNNNVFGNTPGNYDVTFHTDPTGMDGNISVDPLFVDMVGGDYQLRWDSPCVDAGTNEGAPLWDILGNPRPVDGNLDRTAVTDMGAFEYAPVKVAVDIMPEDASNQIAPQKKGMVTVAILGTADFAVSSINPTTVVFGPGNATEVHGRGHMEDVNLDGRVDMLFHFRCEDIGLTTGTSAVCISGRLLTGEPFIGSDTVNATSASPAKHR